MIETERLILRPWRDEDGPEFARLTNTPAVMEHLGGPQPAGSFEEVAARQQAVFAEHGFCFWIVERRHDQRLLGFCGLKPVAAKGASIEGMVEIGWRLREDAWGQGYGAEAAGASLDWGWRHTDLSHIIAMTVAANRRSWSLMERLGMIRRSDLDFDHPSFADGHPLRRHIVYAAERP